MTNKTFLTILLLIPFIVNGMSIHDAFNNPNIVIEIYGAVVDENHGVALSIKNETQKQIKITANPGYIFDSEADDVQDLILMEPIFVEINAGEESTITVKAMCIQASNKWPLSDDKYKPTATKDEQLVAASQFIYENNYPNHMGQDAIWAISDHKSVYGISGEANLANPLRAFIADQLGVAFDTSLVNKDEIYVDRTIKEYALFLKFYLQQKDDVKLQLFDHKGDFTRDLLVRENAGKGKYDMQYKVSLGGLLGQKYYVRLYVGDEMRTEFPLVIKES